MFSPAKTASCDVTLGVTLRPASRYAVKYCPDTADRLISGVLGVCAAPRAARRDGRKGGRGRVAMAVGRHATRIGCRPANTGVSLGRWQQVGRYAGRQCRQAAGFAGVSAVPDQIRNLIVIPPARRLGRGGIDFCRPAGPPAPLNRVAPFLRGVAPHRLASLAWREGARNETAIARVGVLREVRP